MSSTPAPTYSMSHLCEVSTKFGELGEPDLCSQCNHIGANSLALSEPTAQSICYPHIGHMFIILATLCLIW